MPSSRAKDPNSHSSSDSDGGAPLHSAIKATPRTTRETTKSSEPPADDEMALVRASTTFTNLHGANDPFKEQQPQVPRSVPPANNRHGRHIHNTPMASRDSSQSMHGRSSFSSNESFGWRPPFGRIGNGVSNSASRQDHCMQQMSHIQTSLMTMKQYINVSHGVTGDVSKKHQAMCLELAHMISNWGHNLINQRNQAVQTKNEDREKMKNATFDDGKLKAEIEKLQAERDKAQGELNLSTQHGQLLNERVEFYKERVEVLKEKVDSLSDEADHFRDHHRELCQKYEGQDVKHHDQIRALEEEIQTLRQHNEILAKKCDISPSQALVKSGAFLPPSAPESTASVEENEDAVSRVTDDIVFKGKTPIKGSFKPNPKAPAWAPSHKSDSKKKATLGTDDTKHSVTKVSGGAPLYRLPDEIDSNPSEPAGAGPASKPKSKRKGVSVAAPAHKEGAQPIFPGPAHDSYNMGGAEKTTVGYGVFGSGRPEVGDPNRPADWTAEDVRAAMSHLYEMGKGVIVNLFKPGPTNVPDEQLSVREKTTWAYLNNLIYPDKPEASSHTRYLLSVPVYRPYVLERVLLDYTFKKLMAPGIFLGFTSEMDQHLAALQEQIMGYGSVNQRTSSRNRQRVIEEHARLIKAMAVHPRAKKFREDTVEHHSLMLLEMMRPMRNSTVTDEMALRALRIFIKGAYNMSMKIWSSNMTLHFYFPETGSKFAVATMEAKNGSYLGSSPEHLQYAQYRISLVVGPTLTLRDDRDSHLLKTFGIRKAEVLVMK